MTFIRKSQDLSYSAYLHIMFFLKKLPLHALLCTFLSTLRRKQYLQTEGKLTEIMVLKKKSNRLIEDIDNFYNGYRDSPLHHHLVLFLKAE